MNKGKLLASLVLNWWEYHQFDTVDGGDGDDYNVFDEEPEFITLAKEILPGWVSG